MSINNDMDRSRRRVVHITLLVPLGGPVMSAVRRQIDPGFDHCLMFGTMLKALMRVIILTPHLAC